MIVGVLAAVQLPLLLLADAGLALALGSHGTTARSILDARVADDAWNALDSDGRAGHRGPAIKIVAVWLSVFRDRVVWTACMHRQVDEVVGNVESRGTRVADVVEVALTFVEGSTVDCAALSEQDELIEQCDNVGTRLVDSEDNSTVVRLDKVDKTFNHVERVVCIKTGSRFVQEENAWAGDEFTRDADSALLAA